MDESMAIYGRDLSSGSLTGSLQRAVNLAANPRAKNTHNLTPDCALTKVQVSNYMSRCRKEYNKDAPVDRYELKQFCKKRSQWPDDYNAPFVSSYTIEDETPKSPLGFFITTRNLLRAARQRGDLLHADATYKVNWHEWPVCIPSITDHDGHIHPLGIAVLLGESTEDFNLAFTQTKAAVDKECNIDWSPKHIVKDGAPAISNAFTQVFGVDKLFINCWAHVRRLFDSLAKGLGDFKDEVIADINLLQTSPSPQMFDAAWLLFKQKWQNVAELENLSIAEKIETFLDLMHKRFIAKNSGWYEGYAIGVPSTDNALESLHCRFKDGFTFRDRLPIKDFMEASFDALSAWSLQRNGVDKPFHMSPVVTPEQWVLAKDCLLDDSKFRKKPITDTSGTYWIFQNGKDEPTRPGAASLAMMFIKDRNPYDEFDEYYEHRKTTSICWLSGNGSPRCSCADFMKRQTCGHSAALAVHRKICKLPPPYGSLALGQKPKRGRRRKATTWKRDHTNNPDLAGRVRGKAVRGQAKTNSADGEECTDDEEITDVEETTDDEETEKTTDDEEGKCDVFIEQRVIFTLLIEDTSATSFSFDDEIGDEESLQVDTLPATPKRAPCVQEHEQSPIHISSSAPSPVIGIRSSPKVQGKVNILLNS
jgi:hypothetical protein